MKWLKALTLKKSTPLYNKKQIGTMGEDVVARYVKKRGMRILERNWRHGRLELDMVCEEGDTLVFIEVKTRQIDGKTSPIEALTVQKKANFLRAAKAWLSKHDAWNKPCRFDVAGVLYNIQEQSHRVQYYDNALEFSSSTTMGSCNSSWQPW